MKASLNINFKENKRYISVIDKSYIVSTKEVDFSIYWHFFILFIWVRLVKVMAGNISSVPQPKPKYVKKTKI